MKYYWENEDILIIVKADNETQAKEKIFPLISGDLKKQFLTAEIMTD